MINDINLNLEFINSIHVHLANATTLSKPRVNVSITMASRDVLSKFGSFAH